MALNNVQLNSFLIAHLYKSSLVETNEISRSKKEVLHEKPVQNKEIEKRELNEEWKHLGQYKKNILLIVRYSAVTYLPDDQLNFLTSILGACKLSLRDVAIFNLNTSSNLYQNIQEKFKSVITILFGITPKEFGMPVNFPEFQVQAFNNCTFLYTPALERLEADKVLKSKLWVCLRKIFEV
jgi:hypothetical protein